MHAIEHVRYLSKWIGPRGSTTPEEREAARYAFGVLRDSGLEPAIERFSSALSGWRSYSLFAFLVLVSAALFWTSNLWCGVAAVILGTAAFVSVLLELCFLPNPLRWMLPKGNSSNVWARIPAASEVRTRVVFLGHLDTHRTPLAFSTSGWLRVFKVLIPSSMVSTVLLLMLFVMNLLQPNAPWWHWLSVPFILELLFALVLTFQADLTPFTEGANDNATGAGIVLGLAQRLAKQPLLHTEVWAVLPGCEEVGCYGAEAFARSHARELTGACWVAIDSVGGRGDDVAYVEKEIFLRSTPSDPGLLQLAVEIGRRRPELRVRSQVFRGAYTDGSVGGRHGFRALTLLGLVREHWHRPSDVFENVDPETLQRYENFVWELTCEIDRAGKSCVARGPFQSINTGAG